MLGASIVFVTQKVNQKLLDSMLGFAAGVMIAASYWSLLAPAIELAEAGSQPTWVPALTGFLLGGLFLSGMDKLLPHLHAGARPEQAEGLSTTWRRTILLVMAVTLHNIPEGLAIGVAFGAVAYGFPSASLAGALALAIGIGIQNFPEGLAISMPLRGEGMSRGKSFWYGQLSAIVEPVAGVLGATAVLLARPILPYALSFAAGAMIFVVVEELIPSSHRNGNEDLATMSALLGFSIMMVLDVALG
ncbi:MAG: ZIP family metal transporter [Anaerolineales bacterium]|nr:MAG: ZIP family metal transporter [Anaerolineales bacterium]